MGNLKTKISIAESIDPCPRFKHVKWLLNIKNSEGDGIEYWTSECKNEFMNTLRTFVSLKSWLPVNYRDIGQYRALKGLVDMLLIFRRLNGRASPRLVSDTELYDESDFNVFYKDTDLIVFQVRNIEEAVVLGFETKWSLDDRAGSLYNSLRKVGSIYIWHTLIGKFISAAPNEYPIDGVILDQYCNLTNFSSILKSHPQMNITNFELMFIAIASDNLAPFRDEISDCWMSTALLMNADLILKNEYMKIIKTNE